MKPDQLSQTAAFIAIKFYGLTLMEPYRSMFDEETIQFYRKLVDDLPPPLDRYSTLLQNRWIRKFFLKSEELLLPGDLMHVLMRKWNITRIVDRAVNHQYRQLVVLGAGFDHLASIQSRRGLRTFELDTSRMTTLKKHFTKKFGYDNPMLTIHPAYFADGNPETVLRDLPQLEPGIKTILVTEGFFDYLTPSQTAGILNSFGTYFGSNLKLVTTFFSLEELSLFYALVFKAGVRLAGEQLKLHLTLNQFKQLMRSCGYESVKTVSYRQMERAFLPDNTVSKNVLNGFYLLETRPK